MRNRFFNIKKNRCSFEGGRDVNKWHGKEKIITKKRNTKLQETAKQT